jgi:hypothetical protein
MINRLKLFALKLITLIFTWQFTSSCRNMSGPITITPLSPYIVTLPKYKQASDTAYGFLTTTDTFDVVSKLYVVNGDFSDTNRFKQVVQKIIDTTSGIEAYDRFELWFYKRSDRLTKDYKDSENDPIEDYNDHHIASVTWMNNKYYGFTFYKDGKIVNLGKDVKLTPD